MVESIFTSSLFLGDAGDDTYKKGVANQEKVERGTQGTQGTVELETSDAEIGNGTDCGGRKYRPPRPPSPENPSCFWSVMHALFATGCESGELAACLVQYAEDHFREAFDDLCQQARGDRTDRDRVRRTLASIYRRMVKDGATGLTESVAADSESFGWLEPYIARNEAGIASIVKLDTMWRGQQTATDRRAVEFCKTPIDRLLFRPSWRIFDSGATQTLDNPDLTPAPSGYWTSSTIPAFPLARVTGLALPPARDAGPGRNDQ